MSIENDLEQLRRLRQQVEQQLQAPQGFGDRVRQLRLERGMRRDDLTGTSGISRAYLSQIENGHVDPPRDDKVARLEKPAREPCPLCPRPEVLPWPEPGPRPIRLRRFVDPGSGFSPPSFTIPPLSGGA